MEEVTYTVELTKTELGYLYWRMKTNRWYERYFLSGMKAVPWEPWMAATIDKLTPIYNMSTFSRILEERAEAAKKAAKKETKKTTKSTKS